MADDRGRRVIHINALFLVAVLAPIYAYAKTHNLSETGGDTGSLVGLVAAVLLAPAVLVVLLRFAISRFSASAAYLFYFGTITVLGAVSIAPPAVRRGLRFVPAIIIGVGILVFLVVLYRSQPGLRRWIASIFPVVIAFPLWFVTDPGPSSPYVGVAFLSLTDVELALYFGAAVVVTFLALAVCRRVLKGPRFIRTNFRGNTLLATGGLALLPALVIGAIAPMDRVVGAMFLAGFSTAVLGFVDDVFGDRHAGGLFGHARALVRGQLTTGMVKALGGVVIGLVAAWLVGHRGIWIVIAGAVVALCSNLANLFDLRPGRVIKLWVPCAAVLLVTTFLGHGYLTIVALAGALVPFLIAELDELVMLGDTGAGLLGVVLGVGVAAGASHTALIAVAAALLGLTLASEVISFTKVIAAVPPLRWLDELGRKPA